MPRTDPTLFLKTLKEDGIDYVYVPPYQEPPRSSKSGKPAIPTAPKEIPATDGGSVKDQMVTLRDEVVGCKKCKILVKNRTQTVFGSGNLRAKLVFVGEAPGADEDKQGLPFVGRAGQLLTKIIEAMGLSRDQVFICNVLKCRPPQNRPPAPDEVINCRDFLKRQLELIRPKVICALGTHASQALLQTDKPISALRGTFQEYEGIPVMCTYHPAYLLRNPSDKKKVWEDMKKIIQRLGEASE